VNPHARVRTGIRAAIDYLMSEGVDDATKKFRVLEEGQETRAQILGGQNFLYAIDDEASLKEACRDMEFTALPRNQTSKTRKCENECLHLSASWEARHKPDKEEMIEAATSLLKALGIGFCRAPRYAADALSYYRVPDRPDDRQDIF
jgi:hypothetical protein